MQNGQYLADDIFKRIMLNEFRTKIHGIASFVA